MKKLLLTFVVLIGCGDDRVCGDGTVEMDGACVPENPTSCAAGTVLMDDQCVPDGSVVCTQGTVFDAATGTCVVDPSACAAGTVLVGTECVPEDDTLADKADHKEAAEPNDGTPNVAGMFAAPALGASTTFYGCITATEDADGDGNLDPDLDAWVVTANAPMVLDVTTDGIHGLSAGFVAIAGASQLDNWQRFGLNLTGDTSHRELYLPVAGTYVFFVTDSRSLFLSSAGAGDEKSCYFATVKQVALPTATPVTVPQTAAAHDGHVQVFTFTATATGDIIDASMNSTAPAMRPAFVDLVGTSLHRSAVVTSGVLGDTPPFDTIGGLDTNNVVTYVVDPEYNYGLVPQEYTLDFTKITAQALPTAGGQIMVPEKAAGSAATFADLNYSYFDVTTAGVQHFNLTSTKPVDMAIVRRDVFTATGSFDYVASIDAFGGTGRSTFQGELVKFLTPGRYYFVTLNPAATAAGGSYSITSTLAAQPATAASYGTAMNNVALTNNNSLLTLDLTNPVWIELGITATADWGTGNVAINSYDVASEGWLRTGTAPSTIPAGNIFPAFAGTQAASGTPAPFGRILVGDARDFLVRVQPSTAPGTNPTYSILIQDRQDVTDLGTISSGTMNQTIMNLTNGTTKRFIAVAPAGDGFKVLAHPTAATADIRIQRLSASESVTATFDAGLVGADELLTGSFPAAPTNYIAWTVANLTPAVTTDVNLTITDTAPRPYVITNGTLAFNDACAGGTELGTALDDDMFTGQTLPAAFSSFQLFGESLPASFRVSANGWLSWDTGTVSFGGYANRMIPMVGTPDGVIAPFWQDQDGITLCRKDDTTANTVTYQWTGRVYQAPGEDVQYQVVLHANGVIDFIYGPNHVSDCSYADNGNGCTVGAENLSGSFGHQIVYDQAMISANTSKTLTPM